MTLSRFGFTQSPFVNVGNDRAYVALPEWERVLGGLIRGVSDGQGISVLTGVSGSGKTMICRELTSRLEGQFLTVHLQSAGYTTRRALLQAVLFELGQPSTGLTEQDARLQLLDTIRLATPNHQGLVLIADEADRLNVRLLEELRALTNQTSGGLPLVRLVLCGNLSLEETLTASECDSINQRIVCHETLAPLTCEESARYLDRRIMRAGGDGWEHLFDPAAIEYVCRVADGSPRSLDILADRALHVADRARCNRITLESAQQAVNQVRELPIRWNEPSQTSDAIHHEERQASIHSEALDLDRAEFETSDIDSLTVENAPIDSTLQHDTQTHVFEFGAAIQEQSVGANDTDEVEFFKCEHPVVDHVPSTVSISSPTSPTSNSQADRAPDTDAETFTIEFGCEFAPHELNELESDSNVVSEFMEKEFPVPNDETSMTKDDEVSTISTNAAGSSDWIEIDVEDPVAMLDRGLSSRPVARSLPHRHIINREPSRQIAIAVETQLIAATTETLDATTSESSQDLETGILEDILVLRAELQQRSPTAELESFHLEAEEFVESEDRSTDAIDEGPRNLGMGLPTGFDESIEWDVIQPDLIAPRNHTPRREVAPENTFAVTPSAIEADRTETTIRHDDPNQQPILNNSDSERRFRLDPAEPRPYAQLFSRLRRRRAIAADAQME